MPQIAAFFKDYPPYTALVQTDGTTVTAVDANGSTISSGTDAAAVIQAVLDKMTTGGQIFIRNGTYTLNSTNQIPGTSPARNAALIIKASNTVIEGESMGGVELKLGDSVGGTVIAYEDRSTNFDFITLRRMTINGNKANNTSTGTDGDNVGIRGFSTGFHTLQELEVKNCAQQGVYVTSCQQGLYDHIYSHDNDSDGIIADSEDMATLIECQAFSNGMSGIYVSGGDVAVTDARIRVIGGTAFGNNQSSITRLGGLHIDWARGVSVYGFFGWSNGNATFTADGIFVDNSEDVDITDCICLDNKRAGCYIFTCERVNVKGGSFFNNNRLGTDPNGSGVVIDTSTFCRLLGIKAFDTKTAGSKEQEYGVQELNTADNNTISQCNLRENKTAAALIVGSGTKAYRNDGFVTENSGTGSIASGATSAVITHGLSYTPAAADITITPSENPTNTPGLIWVDTITSTQFTVNCENDPGASNLDFSWAVRKI